MLQGKPERWCLWLKDAKPQDLHDSAFLRERLRSVTLAREKSRTKSVREFAIKPSLFTQDRQPETTYFALPEVSSERRHWIPGKFYSPDVIASNKLIIFPDAQLWHAAYLQSSMFMSWVEAFAGRLESRISISPGLAYFPIPFPTPSAPQEAELREAMNGVFEARDQHPEATLAHLYDPLSMPSSLVHAHQALDRVVDRIFTGGSTFRTNDERRALLLELSEQGALIRQDKRRRPRSNWG